MNYNTVTILCVSHISGISDCSDQIPDILLSPHLSPQATAEGLERVESKFCSDCL